MVAERSELKPSVLVTSSLADVSETNWPDFKIDLFLQCRQFSTEDSGAVTLFPHKTAPVSTQFIFQGSTSVSLVAHSSKVSPVVAQVPSELDWEGNWLKYSPFWIIFTWINFLIEVKFLKINHGSGKSEAGWYKKCCSLMWSHDPCLCECHLGLGDVFPDLALLLALVLPWPPCDSI